MQFQFHHKQLPKSLNCMSQTAEQRFFYFTTQPHFSSMNVGRLLTSPQGKEMVIGRLNA